MSSKTQADAYAWPEGHKGRLLGRDIQRVDGPDKATGAARYGHDQRPARMVYARFVPCPLPSAEVTLDLDAGLRVPGVVDAVRVCGETTLYLGEPMAAVAAETPEAAREGAAAIATAMTLVELPFVVTADAALAEGAPTVRRGSNISRERTSEDGDAEAGIAAALAAGGAVVEARYTVPVQHHACLESHGMVVDFQGGDSAVIHGSIQGTFGLLDGPPEVLGLSDSQVEGNVQHMGGGFGSKFGVGVEGRVACELAKRLGRPVHLFMDRETEFHAAGNRSGNQVDVRAGATPDGKITGLVSDASRLGGVSGGSYAGLPYIYQVGANLATARALHTNTDGNRAFRAPGHPQASFGMESLVDELAYGIGMDLVEMRLANLPIDGDRAETHAVWRRQLEFVAKEIGWHEHPQRSAPGSPALSLDRDEAIGIGFGLSVWGGGGSPGNEVEVSLDRSGSLVSSVGTQDLGTGSRTLVAAIVAEELGLEVHQVTARIGSTRLGRGNMSGGSVTTACLSPAVKDAAVKMRLGLAELAATELGVAADELAFHPGGSLATSDGTKSLSWRELCGLLGATGLTTHGTWRRELQASGVHGAQAVKVAVDLVTGRVRVLEMICKQDIGMVLNTLAAKSQVQGAMVQALSYALFEERLIDPDLGTRLNPNFESYKIANSITIPKMRVIFDDEDRRGAIGIGEPPAIPGAAAIANAVHNACGVRVRDLPLTPDKVLMGLEELRNA